MINEKLLSKLRCPVSGAPLLEVPGGLLSTDAVTRYRYKVEDEIPILLKEEAEQISTEEWTTLIAKYTKA